LASPCSATATCWQAKSDASPAIGGSAIPLLPT
jgi:hypothetical protein